MHESASEFDELKAQRAPWSMPAGAVFPLAEAGHFDELHGLVRDTGDTGDAIACSAGLARAWSKFFHHVGAQGWHTLDQRAERLARQLRGNGVTYNVYAGEANLPRPWALELFPLLIEAADWTRIETGILQRVRVLEAVMADAYGEQRLLREAMLPAALVQGNPDYLRALHGVPPVGGQFLHFVAFDLARGPDGEWRVVSQRTQEPSGLGYLMESRLAVSGQFAEAFEAMPVRRLAATYRTFVDSLKSMAPTGQDAHIALLTPGPGNETYFEHSYLARYLGLTLVEGSDLTVRGERLFLKTLHGLEPVHALLKRVNDAWLDPLEMRPDSRIGVPGLVQAVRAGNVLMANAIGSGFLESSALLGFLPALARHLLGEELQLPTLHTWWCGEPAAMQAVLPRLAQSVIKPTYAWSTSRGTFESGIGPFLGKDELALWAERIQRNPDEHTVQAYMPTSQMPVWQRNGNDASAGSAIALRSSILRVFALSDGRGAWNVLPGGMTRIASEDAGTASMQRGGSTADTWVLGEQSSADDTERGGMATAQAAVVAQATRRERLVTSTAAENLFWMGRYTERAENTARLARITLDTLHGEEEPTYATQMWLGQLAESAGLVGSGVPSPLQWRAEFERLLISQLGSTEGVLSVGYSLHWLRSAGSALRGRLSTEHWNFIKAADEQFRADCAELNRFTPPSAYDALAALQRLSKNLAAITGAQNDRMWRDDGWRLLSIGRQIERLGFLSDALSRGFYTNAVHDAAGYGVVLDLFDSTISFHARYQLSHEIATLIEHVVLNYQNPRSLAWVVQTLAGRLARLHASAAADVENLSLRLHLPQLNELGALCEADAMGDHVHLQQLLTHFGQTAESLSDTIALRYFSHADEAQQSVGA